MEKKLFIFFALIFLASCFCLNINALSKQQPDQEINKKINVLLAKMTLEEKIGQLVQYSRTEITGPKNEPTDINTEIKKGRIGSLFNIVGISEIRKLQKIAIEESRLGIPLIFGYDVIHGYKTIFPIPLAQSCSWDLNAIENAERIAAVEASAAGINWTFAPMVDISRDPRWGRVMEGAGEDPYLGSCIAAARVKGFQDDDLAKHNTIAACAKHFVCYGAPTGGRDYNNSDISERTLYEIYLPPFQAAVDAGVETIMTSFNDINGIPMTGNKQLVKGILLDKWGFQGFVVSDWNAVTEMIQHGYAENDAQAVKLAIDAGLDMDMQSGTFSKELASLVKSRMISEQQINDAVKKILKIKYKLGLFDDPYRYCNEQREKQETLQKKSRDTAREMARESIVLLKNEADLLPLKKDIKIIAVVGPLADNAEDPLGEWCAQGDPKDVITLLQGIKNKVSKNTNIIYAKCCNINDQSSSMINNAVNAIKNADVIIAAVGESADMSGEGASKTNIDLPGIQQKFLEALKQTGKPIVVILMNGRPLTIRWTSENLPAIVETWFLGTEAGNAIADVLFGDYNPSGKLTMTFPYSTGQIPIFYNHRRVGRPLDPAIERYCSKYLDAPNDPLYPFGYGLSYTTFKYSDIKLNKNIISLNEELTASVDITNMGKLEGEEIVQLYVTKTFASVTQPVKKLIGFDKILLKPSEIKTVTFTIKPDSLAIYNQDMKRVVEPGKFILYIGTSSANVKTASFELSIKK